MPQTVFALDRNHRDRARSAAIGIPADAQHDLLADGLLEVCIHIVAAVQFAAVDREQVFAGFDIDAGLGQRRMQIGIPVLAIVDMREPVAAVGDRVIGAEQADFDLGHVRIGAAAHEHVPDRDVSQHLAEQEIEIVAARRRWPGMARSVFRPRPDPVRESAGRRRSRARCARPRGTSASIPGVERHTPASTPAPACLHPVSALPRS